MVEKYSKSGRFLGCSKYPECKATRPLGGQPRAEAVESEHSCPKCGKKLLIRQNKRGEKFLSCSGFPECKESFNINPKGNPVPSVVATEHTCEKCGKPMALRQGSRGAFLGCTGYPKCRNALPVDEEGRPIAGARIDDATRGLGSVVPDWCRPTDAEGRFHVQMTRGQMILLTAEARLRAKAVGVTGRGHASIRLPLFTRIG